MTVHLSPFHSPLMIHFILTYLIIEDALCHSSFNKMVFSHQPLGFQAAPCWSLTSSCWALRREFRQVTCLCGSRTPLRTCLRPWTWTRTWRFPCRRSVPAVTASSSHCVSVLLTSSGSYISNAGSLINNPHEKNLASPKWFEVIVIRKSPFNICGIKFFFFFVKADYKLSITSQV